MKTTQILRNMRRIYCRNGDCPKYRVWARRMSDVRSKEGLEALRQRVSAFRRARGMGPVRPISRSKKMEPLYQKWERFKEQKHREMEEAIATIESKQPTQTPHP